MVVFDLGMFHLQRSVFAMVVSLAYALKQLASRGRPRVIVALGRVAWGAVIRTLGPPPTPFAHGAVLQDGAVRNIRLLPPKPPQRGD